MTDYKSKNLGRLFKPKPGELIVVCAWCGNRMGSKPGLGQTGISHGICDECEQKYFPKIWAKRLKRGGKLDDNSSDY